MITDWFRQKPAEPTIEFVSLEETWTPGHFVDDVRIKLVIRKDGKTIVVKRQYVDESLTLERYNEMVREVLPMGMYFYVRYFGYKVILNPKFLNSQIRRSILSDLVRKAAPKER